MNSTNRFLNRTFLLVVGLVLVAAGLVVGGGALVPDLRDPVVEGAKNASGPASDALDAQPWILWVVAAAAVVLIALLLWFVLRQGRGHTSTLLRVRGSEAADKPTGGSLVLDVSVAGQVLEEALSRNPDIVSLDVTGFRIRSTPVLRVTAHARRGASPVALRQAIDDTVAVWDAELGAQVPTVVHIVGGLRTRLTSATRVS